MDMVGRGFVVDHRRTVQGLVSISLLLAMDCVFNLTGPGSEGGITQSL